MCRSSTSIGSFKLMNHHLMNRIVKEAYRWVGVARARGARGRRVCRSSPNMGSCKLMDYHLMNRIVKDAYR